MRLLLEMEMDNAAFVDEHGLGCGAEAARILRELADRIATCNWKGVNTNDMWLRDINGNTVGNVLVTSKPKPAKSFLDRFSKI